MKTKVQIKEGSKAQAEAREREKEEDTKAEALPTGDSSNVAYTASLNKDDAEGLETSKKDAEIEALLTK